jgi:hypothetical protein
MFLHGKLAHLFSTVPIDDQIMTRHQAKAGIELIPPNLIIELVTVESIINPIPATVGVTKRVAILMRTIITNAMPHTKMNPLMSPQQFNFI